MKLIMTDKRTGLEPEILDSLSTEEVNAVIDVWKTSRSRRIFSEGF